MVNKTDDNLTVEELYKEQLDICKYTVFLNLIFVVLVLLFKDVYKRQTKCFMSGILSLIDIPVYAFCSSAKKLK